MGFLDDILSTVNEFKELRDTLVDDVTESLKSVVEPINEIKTTVSDSTQDLKDVAAGIVPTAVPSVPSEITSSSSPSES